MRLILIGPIAEELDYNEVIDLHKSCKSRPMTHEFHQNYAINNTHIYIINIYILYIYIYILYIHMYVFEILQVCFTCNTLLVITFFFP